MRRKDKAVTDPRIIEQILATSTVCRLAMVDSGEPYLVPLNYGYAGGAIYMHSAAAGRKIDILTRSPRVCFEIEAHAELQRDTIPCEWTMKYRSVIGYGTVEILVDESSKLAALDAIMHQHGETGAQEYTMNQVRSIVVLKLTLESLTAKQSGDWNE